MSATDSCLYLSKMIISTIPYLPLYLYICKYLCYVLHLLFIWFNRNNRNPTNFFFGIFCNPFLTWLELFQIVHNINGIQRDSIIDFVHVIKCDLCFDRFYRYKHFLSLQTPCVFFLNFSC